MSFHNFKSGCLICGNEIIVESKEVEHTCAICNKKFISIASVSIIAIAIGVVFFNQKINTLDNIVLKEDGNELYIITARGNYFSHSGSVLSYEENKKVVLNWLEENNVIYDKIIFSPEDKLDICRQNNIDLMIEDKPKNINTISSEIPVICYHANYNEQCNGKNIYRCYSWYDIYDKI